MQKDTDTALAILAQSICVVVDQPICGDRRILSGFSDFDTVQLVDISAERPVPNLKTVGAAVLLIMRGFFVGLLLFPKLRCVLKEYPKRPLFSGLPAVWQWACAAIGSGERLLGQSRFHAHDLYCAVAVVLVAPRDAEIYYDSHEVQFHRNRKAGWLRILIEAGLERMVVKRADELSVVSHPIAELMEDIYGSPPPVRVRYNDFYSHQLLQRPASGSEISLIYVGKGLRGRNLELLDKPSHELGAKVFFYSLGSSLPPHMSGKHWQFGPENYETHLLEIVTDRRCLMWCCHENQCLSYSYSLPNKFFQSLAVGMPVIASRGTYLAELVEKHSLGLIFEEGSTIEHLLEMARGPLFEEWQGNVVRFREQVRNGSIKI